MFFCLKRQVRDFVSKSDIIIMQLNASSDSPPFPCFLHNSCCHSYVFLHISSFNVFPRGFTRQPSPIISSIFLVNFTILKITSQNFALFLSGHAYNVFKIILLSPSDESQAGRVLSAWSFWASLASPCHVLENLIIVFFTILYNILHRFISLESLNGAREHVHQLCTLGTDTPPDGWKSPKLPFQFSWWHILVRKRGLFRCWPQHIVTLSNRLVRA